MSDELLSASLDDELDPAERAALEARLATDPALAAELDALRQVRALVRGLPPRAAPAGFEERLVAVGRADADVRQESTARVVRLGRRSAAALAASAAILVALVVTDGGDGPAVRPEIEESAEGHATNAGLADDPIMLLAPAAGGGSRP